MQIAVSKSDRLLMWADKLIITMLVKLAISS
jgi:hypothetical protein